MNSSACSGHNLRFNYVKKKADTNICNGIP
jgi:hypothetical protein